MKNIFVSALLAVATVTTALAVNASPSYACDRNHFGQCVKGAYDAGKFLYDNRGLPNDIKEGFERGRQELQRHYNDYQERESERNYQERRFDNNTGRRIVDDMDETWERQRPRR
ncbi:hypothetical protein [Nostoc sp. DedSLP04]|uniref:hypothetical protein n=1 Tax=Nostoc sp. DedSLP04 TaxID=3075401 RepID=UPI002AD3CA35|nr:hypothetical protein [Nostoc sp. DedSLP04]MDZ8034955.1 hypothetical protein [Nostoc sp. DedSLP04]